MSQSLLPAFFVGCVSPNFAGAPSQAQINLGPAAVFYDMAANPRVYYVASADGSSWQAWGGGSATPTGVPIPVAAPLNLAYGAHNQNDLICSGTPALSLANNLAAGFGCGIKGTFTFASGAGLLTIGSGITDLRQTTGTAWATLVQTKADGTTYDLLGTM